MRRSLALAASLVLAALSGRARTSDACPDAKDHRFAGESVVVPIEVTDGGAFTFPRTIEGAARPLRFSLDSGAASSYLDAEVARELGMRATSEGTVHGAGRDALRVAQIANVAFALPGLESTGHQVNIADLRAVAPAFGGRLEGFVGDAFIARFVITIDYQARTLTIADPCRHQYRGAGEILPITFRGRWPFVAGRIQVDGRVESDRFLVDTGSGDAVDHPAIRRSRGPVRRSRTGVGLGTGNGEGVIGHADFLQLGRIRIPGALTACCGPNQDMNRLIGGEVLRRFTVILDFPHGRIILEPNEHLAEPFADE